MSEINFKNKLIEFTSDKVLDRKELEQLNSLAKNPNLKDKTLANYVINDLNRFKDTTNLSYTLNEPMGKAIQLNFTFSPTYSEDDLIKGKDILEIVSNISQSDNLKETNDDGNRCAASAFLNAYLLMDGKFEDISQQFSISKDLTYKNVHLVQEKIYDMANTDSKAGINSGLTYNYNTKSGEISDINYKGELSEVSKKIGIDIKPLLGKNVQDIYNKKEAIDSFFANNPKGVLQVSVHLDTKTGDLYTPAQNKPENHAVLMFSRNNKFYLLDTGVVTNGAGKALRELNKEQFSAFTETTSGNVLGLSMKR
ncbi:MAG: hypothetical protein U0354_06060 [Candidatus Sericytochromatia bacterium]